MKVLENPYNFLKEYVSNLIKSALEKKFNIRFDDLKVDEPPKKEFGDLSSPVIFQLLKKFSNIKEIKEMGIKGIANNLYEYLKDKNKLIDKVEIVGGYINIFINFPEYAKIVSNSVLNLDDKYGSIDLGKGEKIVVEHTSANPIHPLHIGTIRNAVLGDTLARLYSFVGYNVNKRFYVNDMGRQVAYLVYAVDKIGWNPVGKIDHWLGVIYSCVNTIVEVKKYLKSLKGLKDRIIKIIKRIKELPGLSTEERIYLETVMEKIYRLNTSDLQTIIENLSEIIDILKKIKENFDEDIKLIKKEFREILEDYKQALEWFDIENEIKKKWGDIYIKLFEATVRDDIEERVSDLMMKYEQGDENTKKIFKLVCESVLEGFKESLSKLDIHFDGFDWESELVWRNYVTNVLDRLDKGGWIVKEENSLAKYVNLKEAIKKIDEIKEIFGVGDKIEKEKLPPNLTLTRSDGTTLYPTRDIAYSIYKFEKFGAKKVFNVVGVDQKLTQMQIRASLYLAGYKEYSQNLIHVAYELVIIPGKKLSARRGRYITFDEIFLETFKRSFIEVEKRNPSLSFEEKKKIAHAVAIGAIRYAMLEVSPTKVIQFSWDRILNFEQNSGPFLQYTYARAFNILKKANWDVKEDVDFELLNKDVEKELIWEIGKFPEIVLKSVKQIRPDILVEYANKLAMTFNSFYQRYRVLQAENEELKYARLLLVDIFRRTLRNALNLLGIPILEKM